MRFFNTAGPCNPQDHYMLPRIGERTTTETAATPSGRTVTVIRG